MIRGRFAHCGPLAAAALLCALSLAARWPGVAMFDSISQYSQASSGRFQDWHPPIMAMLWSVFRPVWPGTPPMLLVQMLGWWGGLGLLAAALARNGRSVAAVLVLAAGAFPPWLSWATVVLKDAQMAAALLLATGIVAHWRLAGRPLPRRAIAAVALLIGYATLVRGNAPFATMPLALAIAGWLGVRRRAGRTVLLLGGIVAALVLAPLVNRGVIGAARSGVERALPLYDLVGIATLAPLTALPGIAAADWREAHARDCYTSYFWNPYGEESQCGFIGRRVAFEPGAGDHVAATWVRAVAAHPLAYAEHRLLHLNQNLRFLVGAPEPDAVAPLRSEANDLGLGGQPSGLGVALIRAARWGVRTPFAWPCVWLATALGLLWATRDAVGPQIALGRALALSAATMSASFALISIASDLRYHLWSMIAAALAAVLLVDAGAIGRGRGRVLLAVVATVALAAGTARMVAPCGHIPAAINRPWPVQGGLS